MDKPDKMSYSQFIDTVAENTGVPKAIVRAVFNEGIDVIGKETYGGRSVEIRNFGVFRTKEAQGRNVQLNNVQTFGSYTKFQLKPSSHFTKKYRAYIGEL